MVQTINHRPTRPPTSQSPPLHPSFSYRCLALSLVFSTKSLYPFPDVFLAASSAASPTLPPSAPRPTPGAYRSVRMAAVRPEPSAPRPWPAVQPILPSSDAPLDGAGFLGGGSSGLVLALSSRRRLAAEEEDVEGMRGWLKATRPRRRPRRRPGMDIEILW